MNIDGSISVEEYGRGIPVGTNSTTKYSTVETVFTRLHAGGKFSNDAYYFAACLHGVGSSVSRIVAMSLCEPRSWEL